MDTITQISSLKAVQSALTASTPGSSQTIMLFNTDGTPANKCVASQIFSDMAATGSGYGTCSTVATTAAKTVDISNFVLVKNGIVSVLFTYGVSIADATLNVNSTGAKPIYVNGAKLQSGVIRPNMIAMMQYNGTSYNIISLLGLEEGGSDTDLYVDMGLPSGLRWAKYNIDVTTDNGFAASEEGYGSHFSWGNPEGYNPVDGSYANVHDWGTWDNSKNSDGTGYLPTSIYGQTAGCAITANISASIDMARINLGSPWRLPTTNEFKELYDNSTWTWTTQNSVNGYLVTSNVNSKTLFFPAAGYGDGTSLYSRGSYGYYWSSSFYSAVHARRLYFNSSTVSPQDGSYRYHGFSVRAVQ